MIPTAKSDDAQRAPAIVRAAALSDSIQVEPLTCAIGAELIERQPRPRRANAGADDGNPRAAAQASVLFFRDQDITRAEHVAFARHFGELEDHPVAGSDPDNPGLVRIYKIARQAERPLRERLAHRRHLAREAAVRAVCCAASNAPKWAATRCGRTWSLAYERLPAYIKERIAGLRARHSIEATFGAAMPIEKRLALKAKYPDAEHPVVRTHPGDRREGAVRQQPSPRTSPTFTRRKTCVTARTSRPAPPSSCST